MKLLMELGVIGVTEGALCPLLIYVFFKKAGIQKRELTELLTRLGQRLDQPRKLYIFEVPSLAWEMIEHPFFAEFIVAFRPIFRDQDATRFFNNPRLVKALRSQSPSPFQALRRDGE